MNHPFRQSLIASLVGLALIPTTSIAEKLPSVTNGKTETATENTIYDQQVGPSGIIYVNGGTLNVENNVTVDSTNSTVAESGSGILILGNGSKLNGTDNLKINVNKKQTGIGFNANSSGAFISLGDNASITAEDNSAIKIMGSDHTLVSGDNLNLESKYSAIHLLANDSTVTIGENANLTSTESSALVVQGKGNTVSVGDGGKLKASYYGVSLSGVDNTVNLGSVQLSGSRAVLMQGESNTLNIASGSILAGEINPMAPEDGATALAVGGINNTVTIDNSLLTSEGKRIIRLGSSGVNAINDGNTVNLNNVTIKDGQNSENDDSVIGILTTNNEKINNEYEFTLNLNSGLIETTNSNLISSTMEPNQDGNSVSSAKTLININDVTMNNTNGNYLVVFGKTDLSQNHTDLTLNLTQTDASSFSKGIINNDQSTLELNLDKSQIMGDIVNNTGSQGEMKINASNGSIISGNIFALNDAGNIDTENAYTSVKLDNAAWITTDDSHVKNLTNGGTVLFDSTNSIHTITVHGDYVGNEGNILFNGKLAGDDSAVDKLIVEGNTSGTTSVSVNNLGGSGAKTINGIELISVAGNSDGLFTQNGRIVAGAYDYSLIKNGNNWYLTNENRDPVDPVDPVDPPSPHKPNERPEAGSYISNLMAANTMFNARLHDRLGETQYTDALTGEKKVTSMWMRNVGSHTRWKSNGGQLSTQSNSYVLQIGGDIAQWSSSELDRYHLGIMVGYGNQKSNSDSNRTGYKSKGSLNGYNTGLYGTWYQNDESKNGLYVDSWLQYSWFNNHVNGEGLASESYKSDGFTASLESGYTQKMGEFIGSLGTTNEWYIQPKAQVIWMGVKAKDHVESNGTRVNGTGNDNIQTRLGIKTFLNGHNKIDDGKDREFQPFVEANWIHNTQSYGVKMDGESVSQAGVGNIGELKTGVEGQINKNLNLWGNIAQQVGDKGYSDTKAMLGLKYNF